MQHNTHFEHDPLRLIDTCPVCKHTYDPPQAHMLGTEGDSHIWYVACSMCRHALLVSILISDEGVNSFGILTDLSLREVITIRYRSAIDTDDVISLHRQLEYI